jgi:hypothetical protein
MSEATFRIESGRGSDELQLNIRDDASGELLAMFKLSAAEAFKMFGGGSIKVDGKLSPNLHRVGMQGKNQSIRYHYKDLSAEYDRDKILVLAVDRAKVDLPGWETYEARLTNDLGVQVVARRWV